MHKDNKNPQKIEARLWGFYGVYIDRKPSVSGTTLAETFDCNFVTA